MPVRAMLGAGVRLIELARAGYQARDFEAAGISAAAIEAELRVGARHASSHGTSHSSRRPRTAAADAGRAPASAGRTACRSASSTVTSAGAPTVAPAAATAAPPRTATGLLSASLDPTSVHSAAPFAGTALAAPVPALSYGAGVVRVGEHYYSTRPGSAGCLTPGPVATCRPRSAQQ